jgi:hypothetical protein
VTAAAAPRLDGGCDTPGGVRDLPGKGGVCCGSWLRWLVLWRMRTVRGRRLRAERPLRSCWRGRWKSSGSRLRRSGGLREQNAQLARVNEELRELAGRQAGQLAGANSAVAVLQRMVFGKPSEKSGPAPDGDAGPGDEGNPGGGKKKQVKRGPWARSGRRDYSGLPRFEVFWDFPGGG